MTHVELENKIKLEGKIRDFPWVLQQQQKSRLTIGSLPVTSQILEELRQVVKVVQDIYEDAWDLDFEVCYMPGAIARNGEYRYRKIRFNIIGIVIHFPEVNITNSQDKSHLIKDLFTRIKFMSDGDHLKFQCIEGGRSTLSYAEFTSDYFHSHLSTCIRGANQIKAPYYSVFCTGSGEINFYLTDINVDGISESRLYSFFIQLMTLVNYESIEGTPFRYIRNIFVRSPSNAGVSLPHLIHIENLYALVRDHYISSGTLPDLSFAIEANKYSVIKDKKLSDMLLRHVEESLKHLFLVREDEAGNLFRYGDRQDPMAVPRDIIPFIFRGEEKTINILDVPEEVSQDEIEYKLHPGVLDYFKKQIEYEINKEIIRESTNKRYSNKSGNATKSIESNTATV